MSDYKPFEIEEDDERKEEDKLKAKLAAQQARDDFLWVMRDKRGRRLIWRFLSFTGLFRSSFTGNSETFFREGQRNVGLMMMDQIHEHCPELYTAMMREQRDDDRTSKPNDSGSK